MRLQWKHLGRENNREIKILSNANVKRARDKGRRKGEAKGEPEGRRSEKEWSVINLIKKLNARARRGRWKMNWSRIRARRGSGSTKQNKEGKRTKEREKRIKTKGKEGKKEKVGGKREKEDRITRDRYVGGYLRSGTCWQCYGRRYTWTIATIGHLLTRHTCVGSLMPLDYTFSSCHVVSEARLLRDTGYGYSCRDCRPAVMARLFTLLPN